MVSTLSLCAALMRSQRSKQRCEMFVQNEDAINVFMCNVYGLNIHKYNGAQVITFQDVRSISFVLFCHFAL